MWDLNISRIVLIRGRQREKQAEMEKSHRSGGNHVNMEVDDSDAAPSKGMLVGIRN